MDAARVVHMDDLAGHAHRHLAVWTYMRSSTTVHPSGYWAPGSFASTSGRICMENMGFPSFPREVLSINALVRGKVKLFRRYAMRRPFPAAACA